MAWNSLFKVVLSALADYADGTFTPATLDAKGRVHLSNDGRPDPWQTTIKRYGAANINSTTETAITDASANPATTNYPNNFIDYVVGMRATQATTTTNATIKNYGQDTVTPVAGTYNLAATAGTTAGTIKYTYNGVVNDNIAVNTTQVVLKGGAAGTLTVSTGALPVFPKTDVITVQMLNNSFFMEKLVITLEAPVAGNTLIAVAANGVKEHHYSFANNTAAVVSQILDTWEDGLAFPAGTQIIVYARTPGAEIVWVRIDGFEEIN